ncbi:MAG: class II aldolase/adducin family protein [Sedimentisphaerales bacterium]|nr:class II aldolase/adducin family protein [Sedimentisphaerales bacterium]
MTKKWSDISLDAFVAAAHSAAAHGLLQCSSGNMSWRIDDELVAVTASGSWLERLTKDDVVICRINDGEILNGKTPSIESRFHLGILRERKEMNVVLHYQSPYATAIACSSRREYNFCMLLEIPFYIGTIGWVDFFMPGSQELAMAVIDAAKRHDMVLLQNHGQVTAGRDFDDVIQKACFFELACRILLTNPAAAAIEQESVERLTTARIGKI